MKNYSEFFNLLEAGNPSGTYAVLNKDSIKTIQGLLRSPNLQGCTLKGLNKAGNVILEAPTKGGSALVLLNMAGGYIKQGDTEVIQDGTKTQNYLNSFVTDITAPDKSVLIEQLKTSYPSAQLQSEMAQNNGMWLFKDAEGNTFQVKAFYDKDGDLQTEVYNSQGEKVSTNQKKTNNDQITTNRLTNTDIQRVGGAIIKTVRNELTQLTNEKFPDGFRSISVQIIGTGKKKESQLQLRKRLMEGEVVSQPADLRIVVSFYPGQKPVLEANNWNKETALEYLNQAKENLLNKYAKGLTFKDPNLGVNHLVSLSDLNKIEITDDNGYQGYFDLAATKVFKDDNKLLKAAKWLFKKSGNLNSSGNKGLTSV